MTAHETTVIQFLQMPDGEVKEAIKSELFKIIGVSDETQSFINDLLSIARCQQNIINSKRPDFDSEIESIKIERIRKRILDSNSTNNDTTIADVYSICASLTKHYGVAIEPAKTSIMMYYTYLNQIKNLKTDGENY